MRTIFLFLFCFGVAVFTKAKAQLVVPSAEPGTASFKTAAGKATADLMRALKADSYIKTAAKEKTALLTKLPGTATASEAGAALVSLSKLIKPNKFKSSFNAADFAKKATSVATLKQANDLLLNLESGLTPDAFNSIWKMQRANWMNEMKK